MPGRATIHEVARAVGVAASTVSRAFNTPHRLKPETVVKVTEAAERMGYMPNRHAQALVTGRTGLIGLVVPDITNPFFPPLVRAAQRSAEARDLNVMVVETNSDPDRERTHIASLAPHCEGLIVASSRLTAQELRTAAMTTRLVLVNNDSEGVARVLISSAKALTKGIHRLAKTGVGSLLYVGGPHRSWSEGERRSAVEQVAEDLGLDVQYVRAASGTYDEARRMLRDSDLRADAVIAFDDVLACGVLDGLSDRGVRVPQDVRILGCDDALPVRTRPRLSTIDLPSDHGIVEAITMITETSSVMVPEQRVVLQGKLRLRETT